MNKRTVAMIIGSMLLVWYTASAPLHTGKGIAAEIHHEQSTLYQVKIKEKYVALTFDDGPHPVYTRKILKMLNKYQAKGTFFVTGERAHRFSSVIREMSKQGHEIGNHTFSHPSMRKITSSKLQEEIQKADDVLHSLTGEYPVCFRPPGGVLNEAVVDAAKKKHHIIVIWSRHQDTRDWSNPGVEKIVKQVVRHVQPGQIILMHDSGVNRVQTVKAVEKILALLSQQGYKFVTVSDLIHQGIKENEG
ncbi:polysaccharide deacetylase family protein [Aneurinibacillus aneurinilyticus]|jgi:polysaccharide deacetylase family sporulation protein PdaB|uniref:Polysaccharide deacetylase family protein n=1 Tax=Aneurinibacillus aneurinilyticus TaxID=1391 RepID=A0A848CZF6_ANEAE|nr:polysaccharide deacetylase family protein [Aneurinibacillus aneurinilyticus]MCI1694888.1 polysaccharide deacetylase family protein [Aneurinibacillus aneurinilyticus]MED0672934.1 polysaccharide deacetylase family protein [Aneurinibacillus aneurinilyticus]NME98630.1 polysaccharide deacetylase family protein [Aneurinibacillus aneurinilyticus]